MTTLRQAVQQFVADYENGDLGDLKHYARPLRAALAQEEQEPVAVHQFRKQYCTNWYDGHPDRTDGGGPYEERTLYTAPPRREWQRLTNEEMYGLYRRAGLEAYYPRDGVVQGDYDRRIEAYARAIEAKLKEKNA